MKRYRLFAVLGSLLILISGSSTAASAEPYEENTGQDSFQDTPAWKENLIVPPEVLSWPTGDLLDYFLESRYLFADVCLGSLPVTMRPPLDYTIHPAYAELIRRPDFPAALVNKMDSLQGDDAPVFGKELLQGVIWQPKTQELLQNDPAVKALLEGLWEETSGKTRDSFQINGIIYNAGGAVYTLDGTGVFFYRPDRALTDTQIANFNSNNAVYGTRVFEPTAKFNCHSYAWYKTQTWNNYWILYAEPFAGDTYCQEIYNTSSVQEKDVIVYWKYDSGQSDSVHSGVVESKVGNQITIKSKFGQAGIYLHTPSSVPYEYDYVTYYRYHHYTNQYTGNNYHSGSRHYFQYADTCTICGHRKNYTWISQYCGGPPCVTPSKSIGPFDE